jgi:hypothetical protein
MLTIAHTITLAGIDADIAEAKRFLADELAAIVVHLKREQIRVRLKNACRMSASIWSF